MCKSHFLFYSVPILTKMPKQLCQGSQIFRESHWFPMFSRSHEKEKNTHGRSKLILVPKTSTHLWWNRMRVLGLWPAVNPAWLRWIIQGLVQAHLLVVLVTAVCIQSRIDKYTKERDTSKENLKQFKISYDERLQHLQTQHDEGMAKLHTSLKQKEDVVALMTRAKEYKA